MNSQPKPAQGRSIETDEFQRWPVQIPVEGLFLEGDLELPPAARGLVLFAHGSGSSHLSPRNRYVAQTIRAAGLGTLLFDLLTLEEEQDDAIDGHLRFDIDLLAPRLVAATHWIGEQASTRHLRPGYFGSSTGGAAALMAAAHLGSEIGAVVSRGGRPDLAGPALATVQAPTLLIVGGRDDLVLELNQEAYAQLHCSKELAVIRGATHLFEEAGALDEVGGLAGAWFRRYLEPQQEKEADL